MASVFNPTLIVHQRNQIHTEIFTQSSKTPNKQRNQLNERRSRVQPNAPFSYINQLSVANYLSFSRAFLARMNYRRIGPICDGHLLSGPGPANNSCYCWIIEAARAVYWACAARDTQPRHLAVGRRRKIIITAGYYYYFGIKRQNRALNTYTHNGQTLIYLLYLSNTVYVYLIRTMRPVIPVSRQSAVGCQPGVLACIWMY